jgi:hypothetical protein
MANGRTGQVFIEDFDIGLAETIGCELVSIKLDGEDADVYALRVPGVTGPDQYKGLVPVVMSDSEDAFSDELVPQIVLSRGSIQPAMARWFGGGHEYMVPAHGSSEVTSSGGLKGPNRVEIKAWTRPFDISYDVHLRGRLRGQADQMLKKVGKVLWAYAQIAVRDSEGDERGYYGFVDSYESLSEIGGVADRLIGWTIPVRVEGELDFDEPFVAPTTPNLTVRTGPLRAKLARDR